MVRQSFFKSNNEGNGKSESDVPMAEAVSAADVCELVQQAKEILDDEWVMSGYENIDKINLLTQKYYKSSKEEQRKVFDLLLQVVTLAPTHVTFGEYFSASDDTRRFVQENREAYDNLVSKHNNWDIELEESPMKPK